jgi:hypothetical protein
MVRLTISEYSFIRYKEKVELLFIPKLFNYSKLYSQATEENDTDVVYSLPARIITEMIVLFP